MFERFTENAKQVVVLSQRETVTLGYDDIGTEHLLLGLLGADGLAGQVLGEHGVTLATARDKTVELSGTTRTGGRGPIEALASIGIDVTQIQQRMDDTFGPGRFRYPRPRYTPRAKKMFHLTLREALTLRQEAIDTEHLLLGLLDDAESVGMRVLTALDVDPERLRSDVLARTPSSGG
ncbi:MAG TPA: Clp protease N-terminal domain-containing protein [Pseudonocardiaceae bacterium]|jgi:ATP-dependent Clp protease ATP-binding subunit ClpC|nr:Clp protease N-terminal domain-containing protein [Pseudonocardiaceae bacterium]